MIDISTEKFIETIDKLHEKIDSGFKDTSMKIDMVNLQSAQRVYSCGNRFNTIEKKMAFKNGLAKTEVIRKNTFEYIKRGVLLFLAIGTLTVGYKVFMILVAVDKILPAIKMLPK